MGHAEPRVLIVNTEQNSVELRDARSLAPLASLDVHAMPHEVVVDPHDALAYVCVTYQDGFYNHYERAAHIVEVVAIDTAGDGLRHLCSIDIAPHRGPHGIALAPDRSAAYLTCESGGGELITLDLASGTVTAAVPVGAHGPHWMAMLPDGGTVLTANKEDPFVTVVDTASMTVTGRIPTPHGTEGIAVAPDGSRVYVASQRSPHLYVIDPASSRIERTVDLAEPPGAVAVAPDGGRVVFSSFNFPYWEDRPEPRGGFVQALDTETFDLGPRIPVGRFPLNVAVGSDGTTVHVSNYSDDTVSVVDLATTTVRTGPVGRGPHGLALIGAAR